MACAGQDAPPKIAATNREAINLKSERQSAIVELIRTRRVHNQEELRRLLRGRGFDVTQATLSRDLRELRIVKLPETGGQSHYAVAAGGEEESPALERLLPHLLLDADGVGHLVVVKTLAGGAQAVAEAIDLEDWPEVVGTVAGDDTILIVIRDPSQRAALIQRIQKIAGH